MKNAKLTTALKQQGQTLRATGQAVSATAAHSGAYKKNILKSVTFTL